MRLSLSFAAVLLLNVPSALALPPCTSTSQECTKQADVMQQCGGKSDCPGDACDAPWPGVCCPADHSCQRITAWWWGCLPCSTPHAGPPAAPANTQQTTPSTPEPTTGLSAPGLPLGAQCGGTSNCPPAAACGDRAWTYCAYGSICSRADEAYWLCTAAIPLARTTAPEAAHKHNGSQGAGLWEQCGGLSSCPQGAACGDVAWAGCIPGSTCVRTSEWYWQCMPGAGALASVAPPPPVCTKAVEPWKQCGGRSDGAAVDAPWPGTCCSEGFSCQRQDEWWWGCKEVPLAEPPPAVLKPVPGRPTPLVDQHGNMCTRRLPNGDFDWACNLQAAYLFYEAQRDARAEPADNRIAWRTWSPADERGPEGQDLNGGWYDAGDYPRFHLPLGFAVHNLAASLVYFPDAYESAGMTATAVDSLKWATDYIMRTNLGGDRFVAQLGNGHTDHKLWRRPDEITAPSRLYLLNSSAPGADIAGSFAAALAATSVALKPLDPSYAATLLDQARQFYAFGKAYPGVYTDTLTDSQQFYNSSDWRDDMALAAAWLYDSTGEASFLADAESYADAYNVWSNWYDWNSRNPAVELVLATRATPGAANRHGYMKSIVDTWVDAKGFKRTPKGLTWAMKWGPLRMSTNMAFIALAYAKNLPADSPQRQRYHCWAMSQVRYVLGDTGRSYVVGVGTNPPCQPHSRMASCPPPPTKCTHEHLNRPGCNFNKLYGAMVGGPDELDNYEDVRTDYVRNEVALDYNSGYAGALAGLISMAGGVQWESCKALLAPRPPPPAAPPGGCRALASLDQCGGKNGGDGSDAAWADVCCPDGHKCKRANEYWWDCQKEHVAKLNPTPASAPGCAVTFAPIEQCGGKAGGEYDAPWPGVCCPDGYYCKRANEYWWDCQRM